MSISLTDIRLKNTLKVPEYLQRRMWLYSVRYLWQWYTDHDVVDDLATSGKIDRYVVISNHKFIAHFEKWVALKKSQGFR